LGEPAALAAFARTLRSVVDGRGQFVTMLDRVQLVRPIPVQVIWGEDDLIIPVDHARIAHAALPGSRLDIFEKSGHMPMHDHPDRFVEVVERFIDSTSPADYDQELLRSLLRTGASENAAAGPIGVTPTKSAVS
jgi:pimeloyl-ACP methyl ester carboxylesterase